MTENHHPRRLCENVVELPFDLVRREGMSIVEVDVGGGPPPEPQST